MGKCKNKVLLKILVSSVFLFALFFILPMTASAAAPFTEGQPYDSSVYSDMYYADAENNEYWAVTNGEWHKCVSGIDTVVTSARQAMYDRESSFYTYFAVPKSDRDIYDYYDIVENNVYNDDGTPYGADYLKMMSTISLNSQSWKFTASNSCADYDFYCITIDIHNNSTKTEENIVNQFLAEWNREFIENNPLIQSSTGNVKEYYIVKTIYNFIVNNDKYDFDVYNGEISQTDNRYRISHTAYGALFGNMVIANDPNTFDYHLYSPFDKTTDSQGLYAVSSINRGLSVCDGYSLVFYYLCTLNDIDCRIVMGDNISGKSDPHAWNMVYLKDSIDTEYEWYAVDSTFGSQLCKKISNDISLKDYTYFLRGTDNKDYSAENHQQLYDEYKSIKQSKDDFRFEIKGVNEDSLYTMVTRRRTEEIDHSNPENAAYNFEDYIIIGPQGNLYEMQKGENGDIELVETDGFTFYSSGYYYSCEFFSLAKDIEYTCDDMFIVNVGTYKFDIKTIKSDNIYQKSFTISPLDMSDIENYEDLIDYVENIEFQGKEIEFKNYLHVYDNLDKELQEGKEYTAVCFPEGSPSTSLNPKNIGKYVIRITYLGNYCGEIDVPLTVEKADLSNIKLESASVQFGADIEKNHSFPIGDTKVYAGKDYTVKIEGGKNYGDSGKIILTALNSSKYLKGGTTKQGTYTIDKQFNASSLFNGSYISNAHYNFTGKQIKPDNFTLGYVKKDSNEKVVLVKNVDYKITGYSNNINVGTGNVKVQFIGNYTGTATLKFYIDSVNMTVTVPDLVYNGKKQSPSPVVYLGNILLKKGVDYTVTGSATNPGVYQCSIKGIGNYSKLSGKYIFHIVPSQLSGVSAKAAATSVNFSWKKQGNNCIYQVWALDTGKNKWRYIGQTSGSSLKVTWVYVNGAKKNLTANKKYTFRVRAYYQATINGKKVEKFGKVKELSVKTTGAKNQWLKSGNRWWYRHADGSYTRNNWEKISGKWYHFDKSGWMQTGWLKDGGKWYYLNSSGSMTTGWVKVSNKWYYMNSSGVMQTGWLKLGGKWYYMNSSGVMLTGRQKIGNKYYTFNSSGVWVK